MLFRRFSSFPNILIMVFTEIFSQQRKLNKKKHEYK